MTEKHKEGVIEGEYCDVLYIPWDNVDIHHVDKKVWVDRLVICDFPRYKSSFSSPPDWVSTLTCRCNTITFKLAKPLGFRIKTGLNAPPLYIISTVTPIYFVDDICLSEEITFEKYDSFSFGEFPRLKTVNLQDRGNPPSSELIKSLAYTGKRIDLKYKGKTIKINNPDRRY